MSETRIPTFGLRYVERDKVIGRGIHGERIVDTIKVLQQSFTTTAGASFWEDVPTTTESNDGSSNG